MLERNQFDLIYSEANTLNLADVSEIFISYASEDRDAARSLAERLEVRGHSVWWDRTIPPGRVFDEVIQEALSSAKCVIVLWSAHSVRSNWVKVEAEDAAARNRLVPVMINDVRPPIQFRRIQAANLAGWNGDADDPEFRNLLASIERFLTTPENAPPASPFVATRNSAGASRSISRVRQAGIIAAIAVLAVAVGAFLFGWVRNRETATARQPATEAQGTTPSTQEASNHSGGASQAGHTKSAAVRGERINLTASENGGRLIAADDANWAATVDGDEKTSLWVAFYAGGTSEAIFGFKDGRSATFDTVEVLIPDSSGNNVAEFELLTGDDATNGRFDSIQVFKTRNMLILAERFQRFTFPPRTARFVKFRVLRSHAELTSSALYEWRLLGTLN